MLRFIEKEILESRLCRNGAGGLSFPQRLAQSVCARIPRASNSSQSSIMSTSTNLPPLETITQHILVLRGHCERVELKAPGIHRRPPCGGKILLDADLAALYGVETKRLNEQVKRNTDRFPADFMYRLTAEEAEALSQDSHGGTSMEWFVSSSCRKYPD